MQWRFQHVRPKITQFVDVSMGTARDFLTALHGIVSSLRRRNTNVHLCLSTILSKVKMTVLTKTVFAKVIFLFIKNA